MSIDPILEKIERPKRGTQVIDHRDYVTEITEFILDTLDKVCDYAIAVKINLWYVFPLDIRNFLYLSGYAMSRGLVPILDCKINDIIDTVKIGLEWISRSGFKCVTINPLPGNLDKVCKICREYGLGCLVLTLMSNPEAVRYFKLRIGDRLLYEMLAEDVKQCDADGCVVGTTGHVEDVDIRKIRNIVGPERVLLLVGIGAQGGSIEKVRAALPGLVLVNVGRDIVYSEDPVQKARDYREKLWSIMSEFGLEP